MRPSPFISVVMSVFNHAAYVEQAVLSVLAQTFTDWELVLINDGSTDRSPELIDALAWRDRRISVIHQHNSGVAAARNRAIQAARGTWIAYLDSDDLWFPHALAAYASHIDRHPTAQFLFGFAHRLEGGRVTQRQGAHQVGPVGTAELFQRIFLATLAVCHRKDLWEKAGRFDADLRWCEDYDLFLRMSLHSPLEPINLATGLRRRHDRNMSERSGRSQQAEARLLSRFADEHPNLLDADRVARRISTLYARAAQAYFQEENYPRALAMGRRAQETAPNLRTRILCWVSGWLL